MKTNSHDFSTVSPSARALLLMKGYTAIPFAREAAALTGTSDLVNPGHDNKDLAFWGRTVHFESRYQSIDQLIQGTGNTNILELSSGFSFRGLALTQDKEVHYIDTDLPEVIEQKKLLIEQLRTGHQPPTGRLALLPLNALDKTAFETVTNDFEPGPVTIVNEGLLMYLNTAEKKSLCSIIHQTLKERGGCWITADVYIKTGPGEMSARLDDKLQEFLDAHNVEENKFDSFEAAEAFFTAAGFIIDKEAEIDYPSLSSFPNLMKNIPPGQIDNTKKMRRIQATWRLRCAV